MLVFLIGLSAMGVNTYFYVSDEDKIRARQAKETASIIGHRIANEIEKRSLYNENSYPDLIRIVSQYTLEQLNVAKLFNENGKIIFQSTPVKFGNQFKHDVSHVVEQVSREIKARISIDEQETYVEAIIPLLMPLKETYVQSAKYGALYLQFDMSDVKKRSMEQILHHAIRNAFVILLMVLVLAILIHVLILKPLTKLHTTTKAMKEGYMDLRLSEKSKNELGDLNRSFNEMASQIRMHQLELEEKIEEAVYKNMHQNHIMLQQSRLAAMGEMINNIAHQWRQPLNALGLVVQKIEFLYSRGKLDSKSLNENIEKSQILINGMSTTIDDFSNFFNQNKEKKVFLVKDLIEEVLTFIDASLQEAAIRTSVNVDNLTKIFTYRNELMQVIVNILNNAKDALVETQTKNKKIDISCVVRNETVELNISDNAGGVPEDILERVFDPYFTTKEEGKGTGIGLYMSKMIIEENIGGILSVRNDHDGAVFSITLSLDETHPF